MLADNVPGLLKSSSDNSFQSVTETGKAVFEEPTLATHGTLQKSDMVWHQEAGRASAGMALLQWDAASTGRQYYLPLRVRTHRTSTQHGYWTVSRPPGTALNHTPLTRVFAVLGAEFVGRVPEPVGWTSGSKNPVSHWGSFQPLGAFSRNGSLG